MIAASPIVDSAGPSALCELPPAVLYMPACCPWLLHAGADLWVVKTAVSQFFAGEELDALEMLGLLEEVTGDILHLMRHMPFGTYAVRRPGGTWIVTSTILADASVRASFIGVGESFAEALQAAYGEQLPQMYSPDNFYF